MKKDCFICCDVGSVEEIVQKNIPCTPLLKSVGTIYTDVKTSYCSSCGSLFATEEQMKFNLEAIEDAIRQKENIVNRKTFLQRLAGSDKVEEEVPDFGSDMGPGKYLH